MITFDLKSGYHHINIAPEHRRFLCFSWGGRFYSFNVLPFGLSSAPYVFTKVVRVLVKFWRAQGIRCMVYFDDGSAAGTSFAEAMRIGVYIRSTLESAGFVINDKKSCFTPTQTPTMLGFELDLIRGFFFVTMARIEKFKTLIVKLASKKKVSAKELAAVTGHIVSMSLALGPACGKVVDQGHVPDDFFKESLVRKMSLNPTSISRNQILAKSV